jgi:hypothetical protein
MNNTSTAGRLEVGTWDDVTDVRPPFDLATYDAPRPGPMAFAIVADGGGHPDTSHYALTPLGEAVDPAELPAIAWVP